MARRRRFPVPDGVLVPVANKMTKKLGKCADSWNSYVVEKVKQGCGPNYAHVPADDIGRRCRTLRKNGALERVNGHGPSKTPPISKEYKEHLGSPEFRSFFRKVAAKYNFRCAICYNGCKLEPHHRTYERIFHELETDIIPVCRKCHKVCDRRRRTAMQVGLENPLEI